MPENYQSLYRKWRPLNFDSVVGQKHIITTLKHSIEMQKVSHAYLFCGPRGTGKTTMARILAKALNCKDAPTPNPCNKCATCKEISTGNFIDTIEIDAASAGGIDEIRSLKDNARLVASMGKKKIYIIDEVHMLSIPAFNALLKLLEEPPTHVVFILATTDPHKILQTVISRCQRFDFKPISDEDIKSHLSFVAQKEKIKIAEEVLHEITKSSTGSLRDALSILEQLNSLGSGNITKEIAETSLGTTNQDILIKATDILNNGTPLDIIDFVSNLTKNGINLTQFLADLIIHFRNLVLMAFAEGDTNNSLLIKCSEIFIPQIKEQAAAIGKNKTMRLCIALSGAETSIKSAADQRLFIETLFFELIQPQTDIAGITERLDMLENKLNISQRKIASPQIKTIPQKTEQEKADTSSFKDKWKIICEKIRAENSAIFSLLAGCSPVLNDSGLTLTFKPYARSHMEKLKANMKILEKTIQPLLGDIDIKCELLEDKLPQTQSQLGQEDKRQKSANRKLKETELNPASIKKEETVNESNIIELLKKQFEAEIVNRD